jgi:hypothetical protein
MNTAKIAVAVALLTIGTSPLSAQAAHPYMSWGELRWSDDDIKEGLVLDAYAEQGIDLAAWKDWTFGAFAGLRLVQSSEADDFWNNKIGPRAGVRARYAFTPLPGFWGSADFGARVDYEIYSSSDHSDGYAFVPFAQWSTGGDWKKSELSIFDPASRFPLAYPIYFGGELRHVSGDIDEGLVLDAYIEQGVDWAKRGDWTLNTFVSFRLVESEEDADYWNNKAVSAIGVKAKHPIRIAEGSWGEGSIGARVENYSYTSSDQEDDLRAIVFLQWSFGGKF